MPHLKATGLPAPVDLELTPGISTYRAPSGDGKTTAMRAFFALMLGKDERGNPFAPAGAKIELSFGSLILSWDGKRRMRGDESHETLQGWRGAAWKDWRSADPGRLLLVAAPHADRDRWYAQLSPQELRDLLIASFSDIPLTSAASLPRATAQLCAGIVQESEFWQDGDPVDPDAIDKKRQDASRAESKALGALEQAKVALQALAPPVPVDAEAARATVAAGDEWAAYLTRLEAWKAYGALGKQPARVTSNALEEARELAKAAERRRMLESESVKEAERILDERRRWTPPGEPEDLRDLRSTVRVGEIAAIKAFTAPCPKCGYIMADGADADLTAAREALSARESEWKIEKDEMVARANALEDEAKETWEAAFARLRPLEDAETLTAAKVKSLETSQDAHETWGLRRDKLRAESGLGPEWMVVVSSPEPVAPTSQQPSQKAYESAKVALKELDRAEIVAEDREAQRAKAQEQVESAEARWAACQAKTDRLRTLVQVAKDAPSTLWPRTYAKLEATGLLGPASLVEEGGGVVAKWLGRDWWTASDGERTYADVCLRAALRMALDMSCHIWVDRAQDWVPKTGERWPTNSRIVLLDTGSR